MENTSNEQPKEDLISDYVNEIRESDIEDHKRAVKKARNTLYLVALLVFMSEMLGMAMSEESFTSIVLIIALAEAGIFVLLAFWTKWKPYYAVLGGIIAFIGIYSLAFAVNVYWADTGAAVKSLLGGFIFKIIVLVTLFRALGNAKAVQEHNKNYSSVE